MKYLQLFIFTIIFAIITVANANYNQLERDLLKRLKSLALDELIEVEMFNPKAGLAARKTQTLTNTAAALFVITQEDIRRGGITNLAEALRMVPGMQVARAYPHLWSISSRGLNQDYASKLLVMIDGRTVYTPLRSSVNWESQDLLMEDVERIEVIRGPGASLWGANAVNGIINIITKSSQTTRGNLITTYLGQGEEQAVIGMRHGGKISDNVYYRVYGKFYDHEAFPNTAGESQNNAWQMKRTGLHVDWEISERDNVNFQASTYDGTLDMKSVKNFSSTKTEFIEQEYQVQGLNLLANWQHGLTNGDIALKTYMTFTDRQEVNINEKRDIYDIDFQHRWQVSDNHEFIWGLGFRYTSDDIESVSFISYVPRKREDNLFSGFAQSEFKLDSSEDIRFIIGSKLEHNDYTGFEFQPAARLLWNKDNKHIFWAAVARAVHTPSRADSDIDFMTASPRAVTRVLGNNDDLKSEVLLAYELGYRFRLASTFLFDASIFHHDYNNLITNEMISFKAFPPPVTITVETSNQMVGESYGIELAAHWQINKVWRLVGTYSYLDTQLHVDPTSTNQSAELLENNSPHHQASLRSLFNLSDKLELDSALYYADNVSNQHIPNYTRFDVRLGWQPYSSMNFSLGIRNLFDNQHPEFSTNRKATPNNEVSRSFYAQFRYYF